MTALKIPEPPQKVACIPSVAAAHRRAVEAVMEAKKMRNAADNATRRARRRIDELYRLILEYGGQLQLW